MSGKTDIFGNINPNEKWERTFAQYTALLLWEDGAPGFDKSFGQNPPSLAMFPVPNARGKGCVLVLAGGGYTHKAVHEGPDVARRLNEGGINAAVLDYRLIPYSKKYIMMDAQRAVRYLRCHAGELGIDPDKIAVLGFSAGGNLAVTTGFWGDDGDPDAADPVERCSSRVNAAVLCYAALSFVDAYDEEDPDEYYYDLVLEKGMQFPPAFIWQSFEDRAIHHSVSLQLASRLREMEVPVELHVFPYGGHGQGLAPGAARENQLTQVWAELCIRWLDFYGFR